MASKSLLNQLNLLITLAKVDSKIAPHEMTLIKMMGKANEIPEEEVQRMIENPEPINENFDGLSPHQRFEHLLHLIQIMKADRQVMKSEIEFCERIAVKLGYKKGVVAEISTHVFSSASLNTDRDVLINISKKYLKM